VPTTFVTTTFVVLVGLNNYGGLAPVDKSLLPPGTPGAILWSVDQCNMVRGKMADPEKYTCQVFTSAKETAWTYTPEGPKGILIPAPPQENGVQPDTSPERSHSLNDVLVGPSKLAEKDSPNIEPPVEPQDQRFDDYRGAPYVTPRGLLDYSTGRVEPEPKTAPKPKRVAKRTADHREQQQAMLDFNPFAALFRW
jgi:hypothetical protein